MQLWQNEYKGNESDVLPANIKGRLEQSCTKEAFALLQQCPKATSTPLIMASPTLTSMLDIQQIAFKDERSRMGLGSFKALGAAYALAKRAACAIKENERLDYHNALQGKIYVCASAGNHGLSLAAGAHIFGAKAIIYLAKTVPENFAQLLRSKGAEVVRHGDDYEASMQAAVKAAQDNGWELISDSSWDGYFEPALDVMEGYLVMGEEVATALPSSPTHIFLQAGVGGLAAAAALSARRHFGQDPIIVIVEPAYAPALIESSKARKCLDTQGEDSIMGRLDCKTPSLLALDYLMKEADAFMTITEEEVTHAISYLENEDMTTSPSGGAGFAGLMLAAQDDETRALLQLNQESRVLIYISEKAID